MKFLSLKRKRELANLLLLAPAAVLFFLFVLLPFFQGIPYSFLKWDGFSPSRKFVGMSNYITLFTSGQFIPPLLHTLLYMAIYCLSSNLIGLLLALALRRTTAFNNVLRTVFFVPFVLCMVLAAYIWTYIYSDVVYPLTGIKSLLGNINTVIPAIALIAIWKDAGYCMIIYIASLQSVPKEYYEVAKIEGCGRVRTFFQITAPLIVPAFTANVTLLITWGLMAFDYPMAATGGGPGSASQTMAMYVYNNIFIYYKAGYGEAAGVVLTVLLIGVSLLFTGILRKKEVEY